MAAIAAPQLLPDYSNPPVVETVLGVQFDPISDLKNAHLGVFWNSLDKRQWSVIGEAPPLQPQFERFTDAARWAKGTQFQIMQDPAYRLQITSNDGDRMIQVQNGRLLFNWLGKGGSEYPRFDPVLTGFRSAFHDFVAFIDETRLGRIRPNQWEVTYVNHIPRGSVWNSPEDWCFFRLLGATETNRGVVADESFNGEWHFVIPERRGRLHVRWQHGMKTADDLKGEEFIRLTFTARGPIEEQSGSDQAVLEGLKLGRETIVRSFENLMSDDANTYWGLKHAGN